MINETSIWFVNLFVIINLTIVFLFLWFRKNNVLPNRLFALIVFIPAISFFSNALIYNHLIEQYYFAFVLVSFSCLWAPMLLWYVKKMLGKELKFRTIDLAHFSLFFLDISYKIYLGFNSEKRNQFFEELYNSNGNGPILYLLSNYAQLIQFISYLVASIILVRKYAINEKNYFSIEEKTKVRWLFELLILLSLLDIVCIALYFIANIRDVEAFYIPIMYNLFYGYIVYQSFKHAAIFNQVVYNEYQKQVQPLINFIENNEKPTTKGKYSVLDKQKFSAYAEKIISYFETNKPYLDPELNISKLSEQMSIPVHYISATINEKMNKSFFDFVNQYRIEEVKQNLKNKEHEKFSLEAIGYNCGFNSKTTFFRVFKKHTYQTPKEYLETL